jgi:hypothetical protein
MAKQYNVSIILEVLSKGIDGATQLFSNLGKAASSSNQELDQLQKKFDAIQSGTLKSSRPLEELEKLNTKINQLKLAAGATSDALKQLGEKPIGGLESLERLQKLINELKSGKDIKLNVDSASAIEESKVLEKGLRGVLKIAEDSGDVELFKLSSNIISEIVNVRKELEGLVKAKNDLEKRPTEIRARLAKDFPKVKSEISDFRKELDNAKKLGLSVEFRSSGANDKLNELIKKIKTLRDEAIRIGEDPVKFNVELANIQELKKELTQVGVRKDRLSRQEITTKVTNLSDLKNLDSEARKLLVDLDAAKKAGNIKLVAELQIKQSDIQTRLAALRKPIDDLAASSRKVSLIESFEGVQSKLSAATKSAQGFGQAEADAAQQAQLANAKTSDGLSDIIRKTRQLAQEAAKDAKTGNVARKPEFLSRAADLEAAAKNIENSGTLAGKQFDSLNKAKSKIEDTTRSINGLNQASVAAGEANQQALAKLANNFSTLGSRFKEIQNELKQAKELGKAFDIKPKIEADTDNLITGLKAALAEAQRLGKDTTSIRLKLEGAEKFKSDLSQVTEAKDKIAREKLTIKPLLDSSFQEVDRKLAALNKELAEAQKKGDIRLVVKLQSNINEIKGDLNALEPQIRAFGNKNQIELFNKKNFNVDLAQTKINELGNSTPTALKKVSTAFRLAAQDAGGAQGAITGLAAAFRLAGTSAFVAQLRTLGFGFSALSSIIQNIGPIVFKFASGLASSGPPGIALLGVLSSLGAVAAVTATKLVLIGGALGALIETGFQYNSALEQTKNASAALAQEFFNFTVNGEKVNETIDVGGKVLSKYQVAQLAVEQQFQGLQSAAITTIFTNRELLGTFQNIILASKGLSPSLESVTALTGQFARVAGLIGISADKLASQVNLVLSGAGRVTSPLQRFLNAAKDSQGIELTAKRIRQLRAEGGDVLFAELTSAISKFDEALKQANKASFAGVISNFQDLFEQISQLSTKSAFEGLREGLGKAVDNLTQRVKILKEDGTVLTNKAGEEQFDTRPAQTLLNIGETASRLFNVLSRDILKLVNFLIGKLGEISKIIDENYNNLVNIYESSKDIVKAAFQIADTLGKILTLSSDTNSQLKSTITILDSILVVTQLLRGTLDGVGFLVSGFVGTLALAPELFLRAAAAAARLKDNLINGGVKSENTKDLENAAEALIKFRQARFESAKFFAKDIDTATTEAADLLSGKTGKDRNARIVEEAKKPQVERILKSFDDRANKIVEDNKKGIINSKQRKERFDKLSSDVSEFRSLAAQDLENRKAGGVGVDLSKFEPRLKITSTGTGKSGSEDSSKKARERAQKSELADRRAFVDEIRKLGIQQEQNELKAIQDRLALEKDLTDSALEQNIISQQAASKKILDIKNQEISNEITTRRNALALLEAERLDKERAFQAEKLDIENNASRTNEKPIVTKSKIDVLDLKQSTELLANNRERVKLEGEISALTQSRNVATFEYLKSLQNVTKENRKQVEDLERSVVESQDLNDEATLRFRTLDIVRSKIEDIISVENQIKSINELLVGETDQNVINILNKQIDLLGRRKLLFEQEISVRQRLLQLQTLDNLAAELRNRLSNEESELGFKVTNGKKSERDALIEATAERIKYAEALKKVIDSEEELLNAQATTPAEPRINSQQRRENLNKLKEELRNLKVGIDDKELISASNSIKDNFVSLFDSIQEGSKSAAESFADLGRSILGTFRNLISKRLTEELFGSLFPTPGQTEGKVTGVFGKLFDKLGLGTASADQKKAEALAAKSPDFLNETQRELIDRLKKGVTTGTSEIASDVKLLSDKIKAETIDFENALKSLTEKIRAAGVQLTEKNPNAAKEDARKVISGRKDLGSTATEEALNSPELSKGTDNSPVPVKVKGIEIDGATKGTIKTVPTEATKIGQDASGKAGSINGTFGASQPQQSATPTDLTTVVRDSVARIIAEVNSGSNRLISEINAASTRVQPISVADSGNILPTLSTYFSSLYTTLDASIGIKLDEIIRLLNSTGSVSSSQSPLDILGAVGGDGGGDFNRGGVIRRAYGGLAGFISGGAIKASGGFREDSVPARLSNGEYVVQAPVVKTLGQEFFDYVNSTGTIPMAGGGLLSNISRQGYSAPVIDPTKFDYSGGGAELKNKPNPITQPTPPKPKKIGGLRRFFGNLLSAIAPFLNFIPVVGPFLAIGAGAAGGALLGENKKQAIIGGILGGLGNAGGLGKFGGALGSIGKFFGSSGFGGKTVGLFNSVAGSSNNNLGGASGNALLKILQRFGKLTGKADGGKVKGFGLGGFLSFLKPLSKIPGAGFAAENIGKLSPFFGGLFGSNKGQEGQQGGGKGFFGGIFAKIMQLFSQQKKANGGKIKGFAGGGLSKIFSGLGGNGNGGNSTGQLALLFGLSTILGNLTGKQQSGGDFVEVVVDDPDADRKNRYGSAYRPLIEQGIIPDYKYNPDTLAALLKQQEGYKNVVRAPKKGGFLSFLTQIIPVIGGLLGASGLGGSKSGALVDSPSRIGNNPLGNVLAADGGLIKRFFGGGAVNGPGTATSDSIPALLSNGEYVIKASSVRMLGTSILDSINAGRFRFADGGLASDGLASIPEAGAFASSNVNVDGSVSIANFLDPELFTDYLKKSKGKREIINVIAQNRKTVREAIR